MVGNMEKYRRVPAAKAESVDEGVVRVQVHGKIVNYVSYASRLLGDESKGRVQIVGRGRAINKVVTIAEVIRRKLADIHQLTALSSVTVTDRYEPIEEGLEVRYCPFVLRNCAQRLLRPEAPVSDMPLHWLSLSCLHVSNITMSLPASRATTDGVMYNYRPRTGRQPWVGYLSTRVLCSFNS